MRSLRAALAASCLVFAGSAIAGADPDETPQPQQDHDQNTDPGTDKTPTHELAPQGGTDQPQESQPSQESQPEESQPEGVVSLRSLSHRSRRPARFSSASRSRA